MKTFKTHLQENAKAQEKAKMLGLAYSGFGLWKDPKTGKVTYKTDGDDLVPVKPGEDLTMADGETDPDDPMKRSKRPEDDAMKGLGMEAGSGIGPASDEGAEMPSDQSDPTAAGIPSDFNQGQGWEPGPDGDNCVNGEEPEPEGVAPDAFVRRGLNDKTWTSGPDGSNYTTEEMINELFGNPTGTGAQSPAEKAKALGLQSDGHGGYRDPKSGQLVARTVNGELAFYDSGPSGGIVSDGNGGAMVTQAQPSWRDGRTGIAMTPPSKPEDPQEISAVPPPIPATAPMGFNTFMKKKHELAYAAPPQEPMIEPEEQEEVPVDMPASGAIGN
jgi:hypothetical protein